MAIRGVVFIVGIAFLLAAPVTQQAENGVEFSYSGATGPEKWGSLCPEYSACSNGKHQSPVNIVTKEVIYNRKLHSLNRLFGTSNSTLINHGFNIGIQYGSDKAGLLVEDGKNYTLKQIHWHSPSEHTLNGVQYPLELHQVHIADDGSIAVVGVLYNYGPPDLLLIKIKHKLVQLTKEVYKEHETAKIPIPHLGTKFLRRHSSNKYYRYVGSLTTPPCTETVTWMVLDKVSHVSKDQVDALKAPLKLSNKSNARPVQPLNGRKIELDQPKE